MDMNELLRLLGLRQAYDAYQRNIGQPVANVAGPFGRGLLGLERPEYGEEQAYRTGQAVGNMPAVAAPVGAFKAAAQIPGLLEAAGVAPAIFIGPKSKSWNKASAEAFEKLEKQGMSNKDAYLQTGTFRSPDGKLRQEISDTGSVPGQKLFSWGERKDLEQGNTTTVRRQKALLHPELSAAYPDTKTIGVTLVPEQLQAIPGKGAYMPDFDSIKVDVAENLAPNRSLMLHELQHAIQKREGFEPGGSPSEFKSGPMFSQVAKDLNADLSKELTGGIGLPPSDVVGMISYSYGDPKALQAIAQNYGFKSIDDAITFLKSEDIKRTPFGQYQRLAGEAEARAVQARMNYPIEELRKMFPLESYDVPIDQLIVRGLLNK
jgi:hypothetical protein